MLRAGNMFARGTKLVALLGVSIAALFLSSATSAESAKAPRAKNEERPALQTDAKPQDTISKDEAGRTAGVDSQLSHARDKTEIATSRLQELDQQTQKLQRDLVGQREAASDAQACFEEKVRAAYKGEDPAGVSLVFDSLLNGDSTHPNTVLNGSIARILLRGRSSAEFHQAFQQALENTNQQLRQK
jgi:hypothetical protein